MLGSDCREEASANPEAVAFACVDALVSTSTWGLGVNWQGEIAAGILDMRRLDQVANRNLTRISRIQFGPLNSRSEKCPRRARCQRRAV
jgi:hypothetical protein